MTIFDDTDTDLNDLNIFNNLNFSPPFSTSIFDLNNLNYLNNFLL